MRDSRICTVPKENNIKLDPSLNSYKGKIRIMAKEYYFGKIPTIKETL
jgi:hypothetical protein